jgi:hypothetical protein
MRPFLTACIKVHGSGWPTPTIWKRGQSRLEILTFELAPRGPEIGNTLIHEGISMSDSVNPDVVLNSLILPN